MPPQVMPLWNTDYFEPRALKKRQMQGQASVNSHPLPKDRSSKKSSFVINLLPRSFINQGGLTHITGEETGSPTPHKNFVTNCHTSHLFF